MTLDSIESLLSAFTSLGAHSGFVIEGGLHLTVPTPADVARVAAELGGTEPEAKEYGGWSWSRSSVLVGEWLVEISSQHVERREAA